MLDVAPNRARFDLSFVETDAKSDEAMKKAVARAKIAYDAIKKVAGDKSRITTSVNVTAYYKQYKDKEGNVQTNTRADQVDGYEARVTVAVVLTDTSLAGRARAAALALGPQRCKPGLYLSRADSRHATRGDGRSRERCTPACAGLRQARQAGG